MKIMVVDDEVEIRRLLSKILKLKFKNYEVVEASEGAEALKLLDESQVDIIFTDINMPNGMGGQELLEKLSQRKFGGSVYVMSGFYDNEKFKDNPIVNNFFAKPFNIDDIISAVKEVKVRDVA